MTVATGLEDAFAWVADAGRRGRWLDTDPVEVRGETPGRSVRWTWADGARVEVRLTALPGAVDGSRTRVAVTHRGLADADAVAEQKAWWRERLARFKELASSLG